MGMPQPSATWTAAKVRALPADGNRYELVDGELLVTPSPSWVHQTAVTELFRLLDGYARPNRVGRVCLAPADISLAEDEVLQPDVFVVLPCRSTGLWTSTRA